MRRVIVRMNLSGRVFDRLLKAKSDRGPLFRVRRLRLFGSVLRQDWLPETSDYNFLAQLGDRPSGINRIHQFFDFIADIKLLLIARILGLLNV